MKSKILIAILIITIIVAILLINLQGAKQESIKIGIITDLTGPAAYWGESTRVGAEIAVEELQKEGINVTLIFEDYQLDSRKALTSAQKLINIDNVDAIYAEFNPAAISVGSLVKDKNILFVYDAAPTSPLKDSPYTYKTYLNYQEGCREIAKKFREEGVEKIGVLKVTLEFGELCADGVKEIFDNSTIIETYNLGETDFRTQLLKISAAGAVTIINVGFEGDTLNTLKIIKEQGLKLPYGTVDDTITEQVKMQFSDILNGTWSFGFIEVGMSFKEKLLTTNPNLATDYAAALAYTHIIQMGKSLDTCGKNLQCVVNSMDNSSPDNTIGFEKFENKIAVLKMRIKKY